jgi:methyl-accepting chemotaxis protein
MRKRFLINLRLQLKYISLIVLPLILIGAIIINVTTTVNKLMMSTQRQQLMSQVAALEDSASALQRNPAQTVAIEKVQRDIQNLKFLSRDLIAMNEFQWVKLNRLIIQIILLLVIGGSILGILISHKIAGPIYRLEKVVNDMAEGKKISAVKIRRYDEFHSLADALERLRKRIYQENNVTK